MKLQHIIITSLIACVAACCAMGLEAQNKFEVRKVDFDKIKKITQDPKARFYYPKLIQSFKSNDTVMNFEAYRDLYYGYIFQEDYNPFRQSEYGKVVESLYYKQPHSRAECDSIEKYAELSLDDNIFDLDQMKFHIYVLKEKKKYARAAVRQYRLDRLIAAIMSSGKGTKEDPWVVICPEHEYNIVNFLGYVATDHQELDGDIDYIAVKAKDGKENVKGFYFDVSRMMQVAALKFPDK